MTYTLFSVKFGIQFKFHTSKETFDNLFDNNIFVHQIDNFATKKECKEIIEYWSKHALDMYPNVFPPIAKIGPTQFEYGKAGELRKLFFYD